MNLDRVEAILKLLHRQPRRGEITVEGEGWKLQARRSWSPPPAPHEAAAPEEETAEPEYLIIRAPRVGIYRAPERMLRPGEFVPRGASLGSIDSMGILNPLTAEEGSYLRESRIDDGNPVEYDQELFVLSPELPATDDRA